MQPGRGGRVCSYPFSFRDRAADRIRAETKILAKAMIKQIDRVIGDLLRQIEEFRRHGENPICLAIVGVNFAQRYTSFEGKREWPPMAGSINIR